MKHYILSTFFMLLIVSSSAVTNWTGASSTNWHTAANWTAGVPTITTHAMIPVVTNGRYPVINTTDANCQRLSLLANASLTVGTANLNIDEYALMGGQLIMTSNTDFRTGGNIGWLEGATVSIQSSGAEVYCGQSTYFESGSNVQFSQGYFEFSNSGGYDAYIRNNSANTILPNVRSRIVTGGTLYIHGDSTYDIVIGGSFWNYENCGFTSDYDDIDFVVKGNFKDYNTTVGMGVFLMHGTLVMDGVNQSIELTDQSKLNNLTCSQSGTLSLSTDILIQGNLTIESGVFDPGGWDIRIRGNWANLVGPAAFMETGVTVTFDADWDQYCNYDEVFAHLVVNKTAGYLIVNSNIADVRCASYAWVRGGIKVVNGSFSVNYLSNNYIAGEWVLQTGGTINLSNYGNYRYIDLGGSITITGGTFNVYGDYVESWWPFAHDATITMSGGTLDFKDQGVYIAPTAYSFSANITGGTIRVAKDFVVERTGFNPTGGTIVLAGSADCEISHVAGSSFWSLDINKYTESGGRDMPLFETDREGNIREITRSQVVTASSNLDINYNFIQRAGYFTAPSQMNVRGSWYKYADHDSFIEGTGKVIFDGSAHTTIYGEEDFNDLELAKSSAAYELRIPGTGEADCDSYDWTAGTLVVSGGLFYAHEMVDTVIQGTVNLSDGTIILVQDSANTLNLGGTLNISGGVMHIYGGTPGMVTSMPSGGNASLIMSGGQLYRHGGGIGIYNNAYSFTTNITGGTILTDDNFYCERSEFSPSGGEVELTGSTNSFLTLIDGSLFGLKISKSSNNWLKLYSDVTTNGTLTVETGTLLFNHNTLYALGNVGVYGTLQVDTSAYLMMGNTRYLNIEAGGELEVIGDAENFAIVHAYSGFYYLNVRAGATISASYSYFAGMSGTGIHIWPGGIIDPERCFTDCVFAYGRPGGTMLTIDNSDYVSIRNAFFLTNAGSGASNVTKSVDAGLVNFINATGVFSGEVFDDDDNDRILWNTGTVLPDLKILAAEWIPASPDPYLGDSRTLKVTVVNNSINPITDHIFYVDLYYDLTTAPPIQQWGNEYIELTSLPAGVPVDVYFMDVAIFDPSMSGLWNSWLQIDTDERVTESNETNNIHGPFALTWLDLPTISDLGIVYDPLTDMVTLNWSYPISVGRFNVYCDADPYGVFTSLAGWTTTNSFSFPPGLDLFFRVKAERMALSNSSQNPLRTRK